MRIWVCESMGGSSGAQLWHASDPSCTRRTATAAAAAASQSCLRRLQSERASSSSSTHCYRTASSSQWHAEKLGRVLTSFCERLDTDAVEALWTVDANRHQLTLQSPSGKHSRSPTDLCPALRCYLACMGRCPCNVSVIIALKLTRRYTALICDFTCSLKIALNC